MLASLGIAYTLSGGPLFAGNIALDGTTFASLGKDPWAAFAAMPQSGKLQMLVVIGGALNPSQQAHAAADSALRRVRGPLHNKL